MSIGQANKNYLADMAVGQWPNGQTAKWPNFSV